MKRYNKSLFVLLFAVLCILPTILYGQADTAWVRTYNGTGSGSDGTEAIVVDSLGYVYITGYSLGSGSWYDYTTIKYYPNGDTAWVRKYNGPGNLDDNVKAMAVDNQGNVYVTGSSMDSAVTRHYATIKYNSAGVQQWVRTYDGPGDYGDLAYAIAVDNGGYVYVTGSSSGLINADCVTIKYNSSGDTVWTRVYNGPSNDEDAGYAIALDGQGNVYVAGYTKDSISFHDFLLIKYNASGDTVWMRTYDNGSSDLAQAVAIDNQNNIYITGSSNGLGSDGDFATVKYNSAGTQQWVRRYNGPGNEADEVTKIAIDVQNNVYITGNSAGVGYDEDYATIKYYPNGDTAWVRRYSEAESLDDEPYGLVVDNQCNVYVTGFSDSSATGYDILTIKYDSLGNVRWLNRYSSAGDHDDAGQAIAVDNQGHVYVTGFIYNPPHYSDFITIKYVQAQGVEEAIENCKLKIDNFSLYPNPAKTYFTIRLPQTACRRQSGFSTSATDRSEIKIYDVMGKEIRCLRFDVASAPSTLRVTLDGIKNGIYFVKVGDEMVKEKLVVTKQEVDY